MGSILFTQEWLVFQRLVRSSEHQLKLTEVQYWHEATETCRAESDASEGSRVGSQTYAQAQLTERAPLSRDQTKRACAANFTQETQSEATNGRRSLEL